MRNRAATVLASVLLLCGLATFVSCSCLCSGKQDVPAAMPVPGTPALIEPGKPWQFVVSGDSRNCGDVVMPAIAQGAAQNHGQFYWHLGDLRAIYDFDEDILKNASMQGKHLTIIDYEKTAWDDFKQNQTVPFGAIPFYLGIGNHETIPPKTRCEFSKTFSDFLNSPVLSAQRTADNQDPSFSKVTSQCSLKNPKPSTCDDDTAGLDPPTFYHWIIGDVDFIYLDNASKNQFDACQMAWFNAVADKVAKNDAIHTVVVGMHAALPNSISAGHSMNESPNGLTSGIQVYQRLLKLQNESKKKVYVLASHSHFFMEDIFNTQYWRSNGGILPGWIVGTGGAQRYALPEPNSAKVAKTNVYGYLLATVNPANQPQGTITFEFKQLEKKDIPPAIVHGYTQEFVNWCFEENSRAKAGSATGTAGH